MIGLDSGLGLGRRLGLGLGFGVKVETIGAGKKDGPDNETKGGEAGIKRPLYSSTTLLDLYQHLDSTRWSVFH